MELSTRHLTERLVEGLEEYAASSPDREVCGVIFTPLVGAYPTFTPITNISDDPNQFMFRGMDVLKALSQWSGKPGNIALWHSHLGEEGPSKADYSMSMMMGSQLYAPPPWIWANTHYVFSLGNRRWWDYQ